MTADSHDSNLPHFASIVYDVNASSALYTPFVVESWTGSGKTFALAKFLSENHKGKLGRKIVVCFKEIRLLCEFAIQLRSMVNSNSEVDYSNLSKYVHYVFEPTEEVINAERERLLQDPTNDDISKVIHLLRVSQSRGITSKLNQQQVARYNDATVVLTTHASSNNLAAKNLLNGVSLVFDEAPELYKIHELCKHDDSGEHRWLLKSCSTKIDKSFKDAAYVGELLNTGVYKESKEFKLSYSEMIELYGDKFSPERGPNDKQVKSFFVTYRDFFASSPLDVTILTACPDGTSLPLYQALDKQLWPKEETIASIEWKIEVLTRVKFFQTGRASATKKNSGSKEFKEAVDVLIDLLKVRLAYLLCHRWNGKRGFQECKMGQTGLNSLKHKTQIGVINVFNVDPFTRIIQDHIYGEAAQYLRAMQSANMLGQGIMRSNLRVHGSKKEVTVFYFDEMVKSQWRYFTEGLADFQWKNLFP
jgi:hypothetical protein